MAASSTTLTRCWVSLIAANGVTAPGSTPSVSRIRSAEPKERRPPAPSSRCSDLSSITASSSAVTRNSVPFLSLRNRFLVWPPGIVPRSARDCSTVNSAGWVTVGCAIPRRSRKVNRSEGVAGITAKAGLGTDGECELIGLSSDGDRHSYSKSLIDRREHLIETRQDHDFDQAMLAPFCRGPGLQIVRHQLPCQRLRQDRIYQRVGLRQ